MRTSKGRRLPLRGLCLLVLACGTHAQAGSEVASLLARVEHAGDIAAVREELARAAAKDLEPLFARLDPQAAESAARRGAVLAALALLPRAQVLTFLERVGRAEDSESRRIAALELLGTLGTRAELKLALELASLGAPEAPLSSALGAALARALGGICAQDQGAVRVLVGFFARARPAQRVAIIAEVERHAGGEAAAILAAQLGSAGVQADALLLLELARLAARGVGAEDQLVLERVRGYLGHPERQLGVLACLAAQKLRDHEAVPDLIVLLGDADPNLRGRAHAALRGLTGLALAADARAWMEWLDESLAWWEQRAQPCRVALVSGPPAEAAAAVLECARQRLFLHESTQLLTLALQRPEKDVVRSAARALGTIPERRARLALERLALHPDPELAEQARAALRRHERGLTALHRPDPVHPQSRSRIP